LKYRGSDYVVARLIRDANDGVRTARLLLEGIRAGLISVYAAECEMNYRQRRREPLGPDIANVTRARDWRMHRVLNPRPGPKVG